MALWTDIIDPATLTGYARASLEEYERRNGTLARWLPNRTVMDSVVRVMQGAHGLVDAAKFRAYAAEPETGRQKHGRRYTIELPALGQNIPVSEYKQLRERNASDEAMLNSIQGTTDQVVMAVANAIELMRGIVLATGKATIDQDNFKTEDDFARSASHSITAAELWATPTTSRLDQLQDWVDAYTVANGQAPGSILVSTRVFRAFASGNEFQTQLLNGGARNATATEVNNIVDAAGLPPLVKYDRQVAVDGVARRVLPNDQLLLLPEPGETTDEAGTNPLGSTVWGQTLTSTDAEWGIEDAEQPGVVAGVWRNPKPPMIAEVISDAIGLPILANANLSFAAKVL